MARLPKSIIRKYGITKKAWRVYKSRKRRKPRRRRMPKRRKRRVYRRRGNPFRRKKSGIAGTVHKLQAGLWFTAVFVGAFISYGFSREAIVDAIKRAGFDMRSGGIAAPQLKTTAITYGTAIGVDMADRKIGAWRMAGRKKILAILGLAAPYLDAIMSGASLSDPAGFYDQSMTRAIGYRPSGHVSWFDDGQVRSVFLRASTAKYAMILASRFIGPHVNKYLPKGLNL